MLLVDEVFVISRIIKVEVSVISQAEAWNLDYLEYHKKPNLIIVLLYIVLKKMTTPSQRTELT